MTPCPQAWTRALVRYLKVMRSIRSSVGLTTVLIDSSVHRGTARAGLGVVPSSQIRSARFFISSALPLSHFASDMAGNQSLPAQFDPG